MKALGKRAKGARLERMQGSPQWRDGKFANVGIGSLDQRREALPLREFLCPSERRKPLGPLPLVDPLEAWAHPPESGLRATWLGHSTTVLEIEGRRILTDPVWGSRASPARGVGPKRFQPPPVELEALAPIDLVLISHDHYDHLDYRTIRRFAASDVPFVTPLGVGAHLEAWGVNEGRITELDWWESTRPFDDGVIVTSTPAHHFSGRSPTGGNSTLWSSYVLEGGDRRVYFGGDSGLMTGFEEIGARFGAFDLILLEIGAYHPAWADIHLGPLNALEAWKALGGGPLLPVHWGVFDLSTHRWDQPIDTLSRAAEESGIRIFTPRLGEAFEPADPRGLVESWWRAIASLHGDDEPAAPEEVPVPESPVD